MYETSGRSTPSQLHSAALALSLPFSSPRSTGRSTHGYDGRRTRLWRGRVGAVDRNRRSSSSSSSRRNCFRSCPSSHAVSSHELCTCNENSSDTGPRRQTRRERATVAARVGLEGQQVDPAHLLQEHPPQHLRVGHPDRTRARSERDSGCQSAGTTRRSSCSRATAASCTSCSGVYCDNDDDDW